MPTIRDHSFCERWPAQHELLLRHFQGEDAHGLALADGHVLGHVEREAGLPHARPAGDDDQVPPVQPVADAVEVDEAARHAGEHGAGALLQLLQGGVEDLADRSEPAADRLLAEAEDRLLGAAQRLLRVEAAVQAVADDLARRLDELRDERIENFDHDHYSKVA